MLSDENIYHNISSVATMEHIVWLYLCIINCFFLYNIAETSSCWLGYKTLGFNATLSLFNRSSNGMQFNIETDRIFKNWEICKVVV